MKKLSMKSLTHWTAAIAVVGVVVAPGVASAQSDTTTINATVNSVLSVSSANTVSINVTPTASGAQSTDTDDVTVDSNDADGYNLMIAASDGTNALAGASEGDSIAAHTGAAAPLLNNTWGYNIDGGVNYEGVPLTGSPATVKSPTGVATDDVTTFTYAVKADFGTTADSYSDIVTYSVSAQ